MKFWKAWLASFAGAFILFFVASCVHYAPTIDSSFKPDNSSIIYGRFNFTDNVSSKDNSFWAYRMALRLENEDTHKLVFIRFLKSQPICCISVESGHYRLTGFVATDSTDRILGKIIFNLNEKFTSSFAAEPKSAIYLGDFFGYAKFTPGLVMTFEAGITNFENNYSTTTDVFRKKYPNLAGLPSHYAFELVHK